MSASPPQWSESGGRMAGHSRCYQWWAVVLVGVTCAAVRPTYAGQSQDPVADVGGDHLQFPISAGTSPSILFEAGGGDDPTVWTDIAAKVRVRTRARTITYDRAGFGKSDPVLGPYRVEAEVTMLERGLAALEITGDVVLVSHSYGGF